MLQEKLKALEAEQNAEREAERQKFEQADQEWRNEAAELQRQLQELREQSQPASPVKRGNPAEEEEPLDEAESSPPRSPRKEAPPPPPPPPPPSNEELMRLLAAARASANRVQSALQKRQQAAGRPAEEIPPAPKPPASIQGVKPEELAGDLLTQLGTCEEQLDSLEEGADEERARDGRDEEYQQLHRQRVGPHQREPLVVELAP